MHEPTHDRHEPDHQEPGQDDRRHDDRTEHEAHRAGHTTDKVLHVHPDEATGEIDPFDEDGTEQTSHGLTQKGDETTR